MVCPVSCHTLIVDPVTASDSRTYEREVLRDWTGIYNVSPLSGLPLNSPISPNHLLRSRIAEWSTGGPREPTIPAKRKLGDESVPELWILRLEFQSEGWWITISSDASLSYLDELAFRCVNLKTPVELSSIRVFLGDTSLLSSDLPIHSTPIKSGNILKIETVSPILSSLGGRFDYLSIKGQCLIKLYRSSHVRPDTCFWVPTNTESRLISILIRYWTWTENNIMAGAISASQLEIWVPDFNVQDNQRICWALDSSQKLADVIQRCARAGWIEPDSLFDSSHVSETGKSSRYSVLTL